MVYFIECYNLLAICQVLINVMFISELKIKYVMLIHLLLEMNSGQEVIFNVRFGYETDFTVQIAKVTELLRD